MMTSMDSKSLNKSVSLDRCANRSTIMYIVLEEYCLYIRSSQVMYFKYITVQSGANIAYYTKVMLGILMLFSVLSPFLTSSFLIYLCECDDDDASSFVLLLLLCSLALFIIIIIIFYYFIIYFFYVVVDRMEEERTSSPNSSFSTSTILDTIYVPEQLFAKSAMDEELLHFGASHATDGESNGPKGKSAAATTYFRSQHVGFVQCYTRHVPSFVWNINY